jgi:hypothetical protein
VSGAQAASTNGLVALFLSFFATEAGFLDLRVTMPIFKFMVTPMQQ